MWDMFISTRFGQSPKPWNRKLGKASADIPLIAQIELIASTPPLPRSSWEEDGERTGTPTLEPQARCIIETVGVLPEARGRGFGRKLIEEAIARGRTLGHQSLAAFASDKRTSQMQSARLEGRALCCMI